MDILKKFHYNSPVILTFAIASLFALLLGYATSGHTTQILFSVYRSPLLNPLFYLRLFGHVLGHANFEHYFNNFIIILLIGPVLEEKYGSINMLLMILATALITGLFNVIFFSTALLGASGVAFMLILLSSFVNIKKGSIPITVVFAICVYIGNEIINGMFTISNISHITHIVGGVCGGIFGYFLSVKKAV